VTSTRPVALVSHGTSSPRGRTAVAALVDSVAARVPGRRVVSGFVDVQQPDLAATLTSASGAVVVPLLLSAGYHVHVDMRQAVTSADRVVDAPLLAAALGPDDRLVDLLSSRLEQAGVGGDDVVVLGAAGSSDERAVADCRDMASRLSSTLGSPVDCGFISASAPRLADAVRHARARHPGRRIAVATYLLAPGYFAELAAACGADIVTAPLLRDDAPTPSSLVDIVLDRCAAAEREAGYLDGAARATVVRGFAAALG
jgi:sirohydrochlorin ferrochelatase